VNDGNEKVGGDGELLELLRLGLGLGDQGLVCRVKDLGFGN